MMKRLLFFVLISCILLANPYRGGELRTYESFRYGRYEVRMKSALGSGVVSSFFTYRDYWAEGLSGSEHWNEIDWEWLGNYDDKAQTNIIIQNQWDLTELIDLNFNPHEDFHTYAFEWTPDYVAFFVDEQSVRWIDNFYVDSLYHYQKIMMNIWQPIYEEWVGPFNPGILPVYAFYDWVKFCAYVPGTGNTGTDNNFIQLWEDEFDNWDTNRWQKANHTFYGNNCDFIYENVVFQDGYMILCLTTPSDTGYNEGSLSIDLFTGWNMIGLPLEVESSAYQDLFPTSVTGTLYGFNGYYTPETELTPGAGYWLHFPDAGTTTITGLPITSLTVSLTAGWSLISGISEVTYVADISDPGGIIVAGTVYGFAGSYVNASELTPGHGYWVNASADGDITISNGGVAKTRSAFTNRTVKANKLWFNGSDLYFGVSIPEEEMLSYQLPPKPPEGAFDVRFADNMKVAEKSGAIELMNNSVQLVIIYDIKDDVDWILAGDEEYRLSGSGEIVVSGDVTGFTLNKVPEIPLTSSISQNYPNPFNPVTTIHYKLLEHSHVSIMIYNLMGRRVTTLVNEVEGPGYKSVVWDGTDSFGKPVSAGLYLYQIRAGNFIRVRKMALLK